MSVIEQVPVHTLNCHDDGRGEKYQLTVQLPGVESAGDLEVVLRPAVISIRVPGRYRLEVPLDPPIQEKPELLRFVKKKAQLKAILIVDTRTTTIPRPFTKEGSKAVGPSSGTKAPNPDTLPGTRRLSTAAAVPTPGNPTSESPPAPDSAPIAAPSPPTAVNTLKAPADPAPAPTTATPPQPPSAAAAATGGDSSSDSVTAARGRPADVAASATMPAAAATITSTTATAAAAPGTVTANGGLSGGGGGKPPAPSYNPRQVHDSFYEDLKKGFFNTSSSKARGQKAAGGGQQQQRASAPTPVAAGSTPNGPTAAPGAATRRGDVAPPGSAASTGSGKGGNAPVANGPIATATATITASANGPTTTGVAAAKRRGSGSGNAAQKASPAHPAAAPSTKPPPRPQAPPAEAVPISNHGTKTQQNHATEERRSTNPTAPASVPAASSPAGASAAAPSGAPPAAAPPNGTPPSPCAPGTSANGSLSSEAERQYAAGKAAANREAALQWLERSLAAARQGEVGRAALLLERAAGLWPEGREQITAEYNSRCDPDHRLPQPQQPTQPPRPVSGSSHTTPGSTNRGTSTSTGADSGTAAAGKQGPQTAASSQSQHQQHSTAAGGGGGGGGSGSGATSAGTATGPTGAGRSAAPPGAAGDSGGASGGTSSRPGGAASAAAAAAAGSKGSSTATSTDHTSSGEPSSRGVGGGGGGRGSGGWTRGGKQSAAAAPGGGGGGAAGKAGGGSGVGASGTKGAKPEGAPGGTSSSSAAGVGGSQGRGGGGRGGGGRGASPHPSPAGGAFKPEPRARPPPRHRSGAGGGGEHGEGAAAGGGSGAGGGGGVGAEESGGGQQPAAERSWDWWCRYPLEVLGRRVEAHKGKAASWRGAFDRAMFLVAWLVLLVVCLTITCLAGVLHGLYDMAGYPEEAAGLQRYCRKYARWMLGCAAVSGTPLAILLYAAWGASGALMAGVWWFLRSPPLWLALLQSTILCGGINSRRQQLLAALGPMPLLCAWAGGRGWGWAAVEGEDSLSWRLIAAAIYAATHAAARGRTRAAVFAAAAVTSCRKLVWYQALPALLLEFMAWLLLSVAAGTSSGAGTGGGTRSGEGRGGWGGGRAGGKGPGGGRGEGVGAGGEGWLEPETVAGATGDVARVLSARDHFSVLGLPSSDPEATGLTDEAVRAAYRRTQLRVHPDKAGPGAAGAEQASKRVNEAYAQLQTESGRQRVLAEMRAPPAPSVSSTMSPSAGGGAEGSAGWGYYSEGGGGAEGGGVLHLRCPVCHELHAAKMLGTDCSHARYCATCRTHHPAADNDMWVHEDPTAWFPRAKMLVCLKGMILDISEMGHCCGMFHGPDGRRVPANTHHVPFRLDPNHGKGGGAGAAGAGGGGFRGRGDTKAGGKARKGKQRR